jgi:flagellar hook-associated protein 1
MNLTSALRIASGSLSNTSSAISTVSDNIAGVSNPNHARREAQITSGPAGTTVVQISRRVNQALAGEMSAAVSRSAADTAVTDVYDRLATFLGDMAGEASPGNAVSRVRDSLDLASATASDTVALSTVVESARNAAGSVNSAYQRVIDLSAELDGSISASVARINELLSQIQVLNREITAEAPASRRTLSALDQRDALVAELSGEIGITVRYRENNDIAIFTTGGLTLFDRIPREVRFEQAAPWGAATSGNPVYIDGVPVTGLDSSAASLGKLSGMLQARDGVLGLQKDRLDEIARGLVETFAETDQTGGVKPPLAGLFTWSGGPAVPPSGTIETGIGLTIRVNPLIDPQAGGNVTFLRDGGTHGDPDYIENATFASGFSDRLIALSAGLTAPRSFDPATALPPGGGLIGFSNAFVGAFDEERRIASDKSERAGLVAERISASLRSQTAPVMDNELAQLLELERSYQAATKIIAAVDALLDSLIRELR